MSPNRRTHDLKVVTSGQPEEFTFRGLRFSRAEPIGPSGAADNRIEDCVCTWTPAQEAAQAADQALPAETSPDSTADERRRRVIP